MPRCGERLRWWRRSPHTSPVIANDVRRKVLLEFPYSLFYRMTATEIIILAVAHQDSVHCIGVEDFMARMPANSRLQLTPPARRLLCSAVQFSVAGRAAEALLR